MNDRIVIALQSTVKGPPQLYLLEPSTHSEAGCPLVLDMEELIKLAGKAGNINAKLETGAMETFGKALFARLREHPAIEQSVVPHLRQNPGQDMPFYFYFEHRLHEIEELPLEALFAPDVRFLSQDRSFAMARMFKCSSTKSEWLYEPPLKIAAVLGAGIDDLGNNISAAGQWSSLKELLNARILPVQLKVWTCEMTLLDEITRFASESLPGGPAVPPVTAELIRNRDELFVQIREFAPHMLHFFCHGTALTRPQLQLTTFMDWEMGTPGSIHIEGPELKQNADMDGHIWLVTLNCCESATKGAENSCLSIPLASNLLAAGVPVVVGMRRRIDTGFADYFCHSFYRTLLEELRRRLVDAAAQGSTNIHWACGLFQVRQSMYRNMSDGPEWTWPVMHTRLERFQLRVRPGDGIHAPVPAVPPPRPDGGSGRSARDIHEYGEEMLQLHEDRKIYAQLPAVLKSIDQRIAEIENALTLDQGANMIADKALPSLLSMNAYAAGAPAEGALSDRSFKWALRNAPPSVRTFLRATPKADLRDWRDERVGWGLVLPHNPQLDDAQLATAIDAPEAIQALWRSRTYHGRPAPVLRYLPESGHIGFLRRDGADLPVSQSVNGVGEAAIPYYLLIHARPDQIPWQVQYSLNATRCVGRLSLEGRQLENYVTALMNDWRGAGARLDSALVWAADHGPKDITALMRHAIALPVAQRLRGDREIGAGMLYLDGALESSATAAGLAGALASRKPGFILTTSHGLTAPLDDPQEMSQQLGLPVDSDFLAVRPEHLLKGWRPGGAIWYAHACCSAGSDSSTLFDGLLERGSEADHILQRIAQCGARVAPLPQALLGSPDPLRAFIGHVEPTFNWSLQQPETSQYTTDPLVQAMYEELFQPMPVGLALSHLYRQLGGLYVDYERFLRVPSHAQMLYRLLVVRDIQSTVLLGDPTVMLPV